MALGVNDEKIPDAVVLDHLQTHIEYALGHDISTRTPLPPDTPPIIPPGSLDAWCALCGSRDRDWQYEIGWTKPYPSWEAALLSLKETEAANRRTASLLDLLDISYNAVLRKRASLAREQ